LEGDSLGDQAQLQSVEFLESKKVSAKRISIPLREKSTGRWASDLIWIPAAIVIKVDRSPVTREWTAAKDTGTGIRDQAISVESKESIGFKVGVIITAMVEETNTSTFLYRYAGKSLAEIIDTNIRADVAEYLTSTFGQMSLDEARLKKAEVFAFLMKGDNPQSVRNKYKKFGITITTLGSSEGLIYDDEKIQQAINDAWSAEREKERADVEARTKQVRAKADADAAILSAKGAADAAIVAADGAATALIARAKGEAEANRTRAEALTPYLLAQMGIEKWNGILPTMFGGSVPQLVTEVKNYMPSVKAPSPSSGGGGIL
jgi:regulator of protease activity HflC (stomatin/prohibitin superfamily)